MAVYTELVCAAVCILVLTQVLANEIVTVESNVGTFNGYVRSFQGYDGQVKSERFLGIPYAEPPVGDLRFKKPQRKAKLDDVYNALNRKPACMQLLVDFGGKRKPGNVIEYSADCLYLNMYRPHGTKEDGKLPVMVLIHGGGFVLGQSDTYPADILSVYGDVIVVVINYRLAIWGFLSTGDTNLRGNYGLWDQHMAIQWVHDNIASFGGDPDSVTVFSLSAGSASVIYQGLFPGNKGLFQRMIAQSGSITCPWSFQPDPLSAARRLGTLVGCSPDATSSALADCLTGKSDEELDALSNDPRNGFVKFPMELVTTVDGEFIPASPKDIFNGSTDEAKKRRMYFADYDLVTGVTDGEGLLMISRFVGYDDAETFTLNREQFDNEVIPEILKVMFGERTPELLKDLVIAEYTDWSDPNNDGLTREAFLKLSGEYVFNIQAIETIDIHSSLSEKDTYFYYFGANPSKHVLKSVSWSKKTNHVDDWVYLLGFDDQDDGLTSWTEPYGKKPETWEKELSRALITMFTNFAKTGDPNGPKSTAYGTTSVTWPKFDFDQCQYIIIRQNGTSTATNPFARAFNFWERLLPKVVTTVSLGEQIDSLYCDKDGC